MPTILKEKYSPDWSGTPPHMSQEDLQIWTRAKQGILENATAVYYDVGLGCGRDCPGHHEDNTRRMWLYSTQKRADVIVEYPDQIRIIELRESARLDVIGRLLGYKMLYEEDPILNKPVFLWIITNFYDNEVDRVAKSQNIEYIIR